MSRSTLAALAVAFVVSGCAVDSSTAPNVVAPATAHTARKLRGARLTLAPAAAELAVGEAVTLTTNYPGVGYWGCRSVAETDPWCYSVVQILPSYEPTGTPPSGSAARITGLSAGTVIVWTSNGLDNDGDGAVEFAETVITVRE